MSPLLNRFPFLPVVSLLLCAACSEGQGPDHFTTTWEDDLRPEGWLSRMKRPIYRLPDEASEGIFLFGAYNNGQVDENVRIQRKDGKLHLDAWWMTAYGSVWTLKDTLTEQELGELWRTLETNRSFELTDQARSMSHAMTYWLEVRKGEKRNRARVYGIGWYGSTTTFGGGSSLDREWPAVVSAILGLRARHGHLIRPALYERDGTVDPVDPPRGVLLTETLAASKSRKVTTEPTWEAVLDLGSYRNRVVVETIVGLLEHEDPGIQKAASAACSWVSGLPPNADPKIWKAWWERSRRNYKATSTPWPFEGGGKAGTISRQGGGASGFVDVELDENGVVWALSEIKRDYPSNTYQIYRLDPEAGSFVKSPLTGKYGNKNALTPPTRLVRIVLEKKMTFPEYYQSVWAPAQGRWGAAIVGHETKYHSDSVVVLDFEKGTVGKPFTTSHQYAAPIISADGRFIALAKGWNWANPNDAVTIDTASRKESRVPIPAAGDLGPVAYVGDGPEGAGFYYIRQEDRYGKNAGPAEIWWSNPQGTQAKKIFTATEPFSMELGGAATVLADGKRIFVRKPRRKGESWAWSYGWLQVPEGTYEMILPEGVVARSISSTPDGSRILFLHETQVFEWRRGE